MAIAFSVCSSARRPNALRAHDMHPASQMSSRAVLWLSTLLTGRRTWQHWPSLEDKKRSPSRGASSKRKALTLSGTYPSLPARKGEAAGGQGGAGELAASSHGRKNDDASSEASLPAWLSNDLDR
jgi:hypothetical protein